jgi:hypothetical protein
MSGMKCISLGLEANFAKSLIKSISEKMASVTIDGEEKNMSMKDYLVALATKTGKNFINPQMHTPGVYNPKLDKDHAAAKGLGYYPASVNPLNVNKDITIYDAVVNRKKKEGENHERIINVEAVIPNRELVKFYPEIIEKLKKGGYPYIQTMLAQNTIVLSTISVDKNGRIVSKPGVDSNGLPLMKQAVDKVTKQPLFDSSGNPVLEQKKIPTTSLKVLTYDPYGGRETVAESSILVESIILDAIYNETKVQAMDLVSKKEEYMASLTAKMQEKLSQLDEHAKIEVVDSSAISELIDGGAQVSTQATFKITSNKISQVKKMIREKA